jgi:hypothetical protein
METANRSTSLFLRNSGRKTALHFSWNCTHASALSVAGGSVVCQTASLVRPVGFTDKDVFSR